MTKPEDMTNEELLDNYVAELAGDFTDTDDRDAYRAELLRRLGAAGSASPGELERVAAKIASDPEIRESLTASLEDSKAGRVYTTAQVKERLASGSVSTHGPRPRCPNVDELAMVMAYQHKDHTVESRKQLWDSEIGPWKKQWRETAQRAIDVFFAAAPAEDTKEKA